MRFGSFLLSSAALFLYVPSCHGDTTYDASALDGPDSACMEDTGNLLGDYPRLLDATVDYSMAMQLPGVTTADKTDLSHLTVSYPDDAVTEVRDACIESAGRFMYMEEASYDCVANGEESHMTLKNAANCVADSESCIGINQEHLLEDVWSSMGMECKRSEGKKSNFKKLDRSRTFGYILLVLVAAALVSINVMRYRTSKQEDEENLSNLRDLGLDPADFENTPKNPNPIV